MSNSTLPPGEPPATIISAPTTQNQPTYSGPSPGGSGRTYRLADGPNPIKDINEIRTLLSTTLQEPTLKLLNGENAYKIPHSLAEIEDIIENSELRSHLPAIIEMLKESLDSVENSMDINNSVAEENVLWCLLEIIHKKIEDQGGEKTSSTTAAAVNIGEHGVAEKPLTDTAAPTPSAHRNYLTSASNAAADTPCSLVTDHSNQQQSRISFSNYRAMSRLVKEIALLTKAAARLDANQHHRLAGMALSGKRLGAHQISWERRQALQKTASLPEQSTLSQAMRQGFSKDSDNPFIYLMRISGPGANLTRAAAQKTEITKNNPNNTTAFQSERKPKISTETTIVQHSTSNQQPLVYHSLPPVASDFSIASRSFQTLTEGSKPLLASERAISRALFLAPLNEMIDQLNKIKPPLDTSVKQKLAEQSSKGEFATKQALQKQLESVDLAVTELLNWEKKKRDPCIAEKQMEELLKLLETLISQWQHQLLPRPIVAALKNLRESYQQLKHAHQLAAAACRRKPLNLPG